MHALLYLPCPSCRDVRAIESPPCLEGHGADCPDRVCTECGTGFVLDPILPRPAARPARRAAQPPRAA